MSSNLFVNVEFFIAPSIPTYVIFTPAILDSAYNISYNIFITGVRLKEEYIVKTLPQISEAEFEVMKIIWKYAPISTNEITDRLVKTTTWSPKTIQTLIKRLVTKGVLSYEKQSRVFVYTPLVDEAEYIGQESNTFLMTK